MAEKNDAKKSAAAAGVEKEVRVTAIEPLYKKGKTIPVNRETTLPESAAKILAAKNKLKIIEE